MGKIKKVWPPDSPYYRWYVRLDKYFSRKHRYSSDENFRQSVTQQRKTANMMARIFQVVLPLSLILLFSCKGKEKHYEIDLITKSGDHQEGQFYHQGIKLSNDGYTARYQFIRENQGKLDTIIFYFVERNGKANPEEITIIGAQPDTAKQLSLPPNTISFDSSQKLSWQDKTIKFLDCYRANKDDMALRDQMELHYNYTGKEKYRKLFYFYQDKMNYYTNLQNKYK